jgi:phage gp36-like protein
MTYAVLADIEAELKKVVFTANSPINIDAINDFLDQADALINMYIGNRYATPVTAPQSILVLKKIEIDIVVYRYAKITNLKRSVNIPDERPIQDITEGSSYKESMKLLAGIRDNIFDLPDSTPVRPSSGLASYHTEPGNDDEPVFKKGVEQW